MPNPPVPVELHKKHGTYRKDRHGSPSTVIAAVTDPPEPPADLGDDGRRLWQLAWSDGVVWLALSDQAMVAEACRLADDLATARRRYDATTEPADGRMVVGFSTAMTSALSALGFTPTARTRLGVAQIKSVSALEQLAAKRIRGS